MDGPTATEQSARVNDPGRPASGEHQDAFLERRGPAGFAVALGGAIVAYSAIAGAKDGLDLRHVALLLSLQLAIAAVGVVAGGVIAFMFALPRQDAKPTLPGAAHGLERQTDTFGHVFGFLRLVVAVVALSQFAMIAKGFETASDWFVETAGHPLGAELMFAFVLVSADILGFLLVYLGRRRSALAGRHRRARATV